MRSSTKNSIAYNFIVEEEAQNDVVEAYLYYEEKQEGLGDRFLKELHARYKQISEHPQHYSYISVDKEKTLRSVKIKGFPYIVIYDFSDEDVTVYVVHNCYKNRKGYYE